MLRTIEPDAQIAVKFDGTRHLRSEKLENWLLMRRPVLIFAAAGSLGAAVSAILIPSFDDTQFAIVYTVFAIATACVAAAAVGRESTIMKFETGPRFLDIPRLYRALWLAILLILPCLFLQVLYPLKIVLLHRFLTAKDVKPIEEIATLYDSIGKGSIRLIFPTIKGEDGAIPTVDIDKANEIVKVPIESTKTLIDLVVKHFSAFKQLMSRYPTLLSSWESGVDSELNQLLEILNKRLDRLIADTNVDSINKKIASQHAQLQERLNRASEEYRRIPDGVLKGIEDGFKQLETSYSVQINDDKTEGNCMTSEWLRCEVAYRLGQLSQLRADSFGQAVFPAKTSISRDTSLYVLMFGWHGILPVLAIAGTLGVLFRVNRLTDAGGAIIIAAVGILLVIILTVSGLPLEDPIRMIDPEQTVLSAFLSFVILVTWCASILVLWTIYAHVANPRAKNVWGTFIRLTMLVLPALLLLPMAFFSMISDNKGLVQWLIWPIVAGALVLLGRLIYWLDRLMLDANCRPRLG
jgi:hypothetical protein